MVVEMAKGYVEVVVVVVVVAPDALFVAVGKSEVVLAAEAKTDVEAEY